MYLIAYFLIAITIQPIAYELSDNSFDSNKNISARGTFIWNGVVDLDNDYFLPIVDGVQEYELSIYDRLGKRVFRTDKYTNEYCTTGCDEAWDGKINGSSDFCTIGVYVYHIIVTDVNGKLRNYEGTVSLVR